MSSGKGGTGGLRRRVVIAFALFGCVLTLLFASLVWGAAHYSEDRMIMRSLELELERYLTARATDLGAPLPRTPWLQGTFDAEALPPDLRSWTGRADGIYERAQPWIETESSNFMEYFLLIHTLESGQRLYLYLDADQTEVFDDHLAFIGFTLLGAVGGVTLIAIALGRMTARRVIAPVIELADRVARLEKEPDGVLSSAGFADDEVGLLARALESSTARSRAFLERERRFTRDASHELRSPVTVVRGAVELLGSLPEAETPRIRRPLDRIRRAADDMSRLIDAFLWLAREEDLSEGSSPRSLQEVAENAVARHHHLLDGKPVRVELEIDPEARVHAPDGVLGIVLGNLVANAFFFTQEGSIELGGDASSLYIEDSGPGIPADRRRAVLAPHERGHTSHGFGLGLAIVRDLCERFGWRLELGEATGVSTEGHSGTRAAIHFEGP
ncbi:MAG: HAMP domain-containing histidine kinase [Holophagales bacterium]|nr:HAMP domain-containing histidine kinase [Holophagales bacterium]